MNTISGRIVGMAALVAILLGVYALISAGDVANGLRASAKLQPMKKPPQIAGEVLEGTGI